ncbi:MAG TPA: PadR family transcriptional regulator [Actinobacteria bacterium]|nr:PadR family transcriptional regulator [Actinomycetota bacterium]HCK78630.1 PadR family transcriptional regulator [Actinomycetota bacterium]
MAGTRTAQVLEFAILGLLHDSPLHGYELRKRLAQSLGTFRAFSYGSLYPALRQMTNAGLITADAESASGRRSKIVYRLTAEGKERFQELTSQSGPAAWEDETFGVHLAFFARTAREDRLRILEGRRSRLEERLDILRGSLRQAGERMDGYTLALQEHGMESVEREVRWLNELIATERDGAPSPSRSTASQDAPAKKTRNKE